MGGYGRKMGGGGRTVSDALAVRYDPAGALPKKGYTVALLQRCMERGVISQERQEALRLALHRAVSERAAAYTKGRMTTVTKQQAEAFYVSVLYQLDAALLAMDSDETAAEALCHADITKLLDAGMMQLLRCYEEAKDAFRHAYALTKPFATVFFRELLNDFARFTTNYDARFHADAVKVNVVYPLMGDRRIELPGLLGMHAYYTALDCEGRILSAFPRAQIIGMMKCYAKRYLTSWDMIAESIADLVMRQWLCRALLGDPSAELTLPPDAEEQLEERLALVPEERLAEQMRQVLAQSVLADDEDVLRYCMEAVPHYAESLHRRIAEKHLHAWIIADFCAAE